MTKQDADSQVPLLFLVSDTGGGHRSAAFAVSQALELSYPGRFAPVIEDPLRQGGAPARLRWVTALYGPGIRLTPWLWGAFWHSSNARQTFRLYEQALFAPVYRTVSEAVARHRPALIVSFHAMTSRPAVRARARNASLPPALVITVITDLVTPHQAWRYGGVDMIVVPSAAVRTRCQLDGIAPERLVDLGLPVRAEFGAWPAEPRDRAALRRSLGVSEDRFFVVVLGGAEGSGDLARRAAALVGRLDDIEVAALCGRNAGARRRLTRLAGKAGGRLVVKGFVDNMADWLHAADIVVSKAGPGTIAEATACGAPLILTSYVPGQERGNADYVARAGAGCYQPTLRGLVAEISALRQDPARLAAMRAASAGLGRPAAALDIAALIASLAGRGRASAGRALNGQGGTR